jgi:polyhydroxybutyrate depolymerase
VSRRSSSGRLAWLACACLAAAAACSRADLDAITPAPVGGAGGGGGGAPVTCPSPALPPGESMQTVQVSGTARSYLLHVPTAYDGSRPAPLIVDFHAINGSGAQQRAGSPFPDVTDPDGVVMAFPTGLDGPAGNAWNIGPCCVAGVDDVAFVRAVVAHARATACIDPRRVYATGFSMGGGMAHYVACHAADLFAAAAPIAFDLLQENAPGCQPPRPITVISFRGAADPLISYDGGPSAVVPGMPVTFLGAQATFAKWAELDGCTGSPSAPDARGCSAYPGCAGGAEVLLCGRQMTGQDASDAEVAWPVLQRHALP